ncbi:SRPBCC family protein [Mechercharimyces sp. CAU 1602]|uniref:SRPBCC family protein n=1 Tax=Mechercharimyces sp. CAU 1602 TaxID=2973933 RepID=UPI002163DA0A|nr:SRPBCC family protein [Mechercharimyces sp. CAU 1602]MCS1351253.1 SRPBCC family protein [Mechercharimyces sp. CAU 1602]
MHTITRKLHLPISLTTAWKFFTDVSNIEQITSPKINLNLHTPHGTYLYPGMLFHIIVELIPFVPLRWTSVVSHMKTNQSFIDQQIAGPFTFWHHEHHFQSKPDGSVLMTDIISYQLPGGPAGRAAHSLFAAKQIERFIEEREANILFHFSPH